MLKHATYAISESDYLAAQKIAAKWPAPRMLFYSGLGLILIALAIFGPASARPATIGGFIGMFGWLAIHRYVFFPRFVKRQYHQYKMLQETGAIELSDIGIHLTSESGNLTLAWNKLYGWRNGANYILVYPAAGVFHIIPKSIQADGFDIPGLIDRLTQRVGKPD